MEIEQKGRVVRVASEGGAHLSMHTYRYTVGDALRVLVRTLAKVPRSESEFLLFLTGDHLHGAKR